MKIIFLGTPNFSKSILKELIENNFNVVAVVTKPDKPVGRGQKMKSTPVKKLSQKENITILEPGKISNIKSKIKKIEPDLGIIAAYGQIIPKEILEIPKHGFLNIHPSLLPKYRGPTPIQAAILSGDKKTGVSIILMDKKIDHGSIVAQKEIEIKKPTYKELFKELTKVSKNLIVKTIPKWIDNEIKPEKQDENKASYTSLLSKEDGKVDWKEKAIEIERKVRAYNPWPSTFTYLNNKLLKIFNAKVLKQNGYPKNKPSKILKTENDKLIIQTGKDLLRLKKIQIEGKKAMSDSAFIKGHKQIIGKTLN